MNISKAQIFNITLNILGVSNPLENTESSDNRAILLNNYYELARDCVLKDFDWNFASKMRVLSLSDKNDSLNPYRYCYDYPNDCICARDIFEKNTYKIEKFKISALENDNKVIFTDVKNAVLRYTKRVEKEIYYSCEFTIALCYYLASLTSSVLVGGLQKGEMAYEKYKLLLRHAKYINAQEGADYLCDENTYLDSRY